MDAGLDVFLSFFLIELETGVSFTHAWAAAIQRSPFPLQDTLNASYVRFREKGMSLSESLHILTKENQSTWMERSAGLIEHVYVHGDSFPARQALRRLIMELRNRTRLEWKTYSQKLVLFSVVFIGISTLVPALFLAFVTIGGRFLELSITPMQILLTAWVGFPLLDGLVLVLVSTQTPVQARTHAMVQSFNLKLFSLDGMRTYAHAFQEKVEHILHANGMHGGMNRLVWLSVVEGCGLFVIAWTFFLRNPILDAGWMCIFLGLALGPFVVHLVYHFMQYEKNTQKMEEQAADTLSIFVSIPSTLSFVQRLNEIARLSQHPLREEWKQIIEQIGKGKNVSDALLTLGERRDSRILETVSALLVRAYESGHSIEQPALALAEEITAFHASEHERRATLFVEKCTLLLAGGLLVPFLLGILVGVVGTLPLGYDMDPVATEHLMHTALLSIRGYLFLYAILASIFIGFQDNRLGSALFYILLLVPCAQLLFALGAWWMGSG